jgi:hypothetical protein
MPAPLDPLVKANRELERLKLDNARLRSLNKKLLRRGGGYDDFMEQFREIIDTDHKFKYDIHQKVKTLDPLDKLHEEVAVAMVSDLHLTENVRLEDSNGINVYNTMIAANRLWVHQAKIKSILGRHRGMYNLSKIWSPLLGDIINGSIHQEMIFTNDLTDPAAVVLGARLLHMFYTELKTLGLPIEVDTIHGNHPRLTAKMPTKRQAHTNLDWLMYEYLSDLFQRDDQVAFNVHTSQIGMKKVYGWNVVFEHGIDVKSGAEEQFEDRIRALFDDPTYREATGYKGPAFDLLLIGNMHKIKCLERTMVNGTYTGQNELGQSWRLKPIKAMQMLFGMSKKHCTTWHYKIDMTDMKSSKAENPFSEYAAWFMKKHGK